MSNEKCGAGEARTDLRGALVGLANYLENNGHAACDILVIRDAAVEIEQLQGEIAGASQISAMGMREQCAKVDPLSVPCPWPLCKAKAKEMCWDVRRGPSVVHHMRWAAAVRNLPLRRDG